jgi:hypothetical protein
MSITTRIEVDCQVSGVKYYVSRPIIFMVSMYPFH